MQDSLFKYYHRYQETLQASYLWLTLGPPTSMQ